MPATSLRLEDLEEFELVRRISRQAVNENPDLLQGVRQLDETEQLEPLLRQILADGTDTPHSSTEIADILTTHATRAGTPLLAAFVNKGKATPRVTSARIGHQLLRLRQILDVGLAVLLAVGDIHDDAKRGLLQVAGDAGAEYMIVDATDVARLLVAYRKICPKDGRPYVEGRCPICGTHADEPVELTQRVHEDVRYDVLDQRDISVGGVKRYTARVVTDPHYPRAVLRDVVAAVTTELRHSRFYRSGANERTFGDRDADCVALFVYISDRDRQQNNWICRTLWCRPDLPAERRPQIEGHERLGEIVVDWSSDYEHLREFWSQQAVGKESWVAAVEPLAWEAERKTSEAERLLVGYGDGRIGADDLGRALGGMEPRAREMLDETGLRGIPPVDCEECDSAFLNALSSCHDVFLPFASGGGAAWTQNQKIALARDALNRYRDQMSDFRYEWRKIGRR